MFLFCTVVDASTLQALLYDYTFVPRSAPIPGSNYSPVSYTPPTPGTRVNEDTAYYYGMIKRALARTNRGTHPAQRINIKLSGGQLSFSVGVYTILQLNNVTTALQLSNIYHLLKATELNLEVFFNSLRSDGIPTLVQAIRTGNTPPYDYDGFELA
jgi:hypothetical protein